MKRIALFLLASSMSVSAFADSESWGFAQSVGGIAVEAPSLWQSGWVLPVRVDVSGLQTVTTKATTLNSTLVCERINFVIEGRNIYITIVSAPAHPNAQSLCPPIILGEMLPGKYSIFYRGPSETPVNLAEVYLGEDGPVDTAKIAKVIKQADKIVVFEDAFMDSKVIFNSTSVKDIAEFNDALSIVLPPPPLKNGTVCACAPISAGPAVRLYSGGTELVLVTNINRHPIGKSRWGYSAILIHIDPEKWLRWFDARNIPVPLNEHETALARDKKRSEVR